MVYTLGRMITFVVDEANVPDHKMQLASNEKKMEVRKLLDGMASNHLKMAGPTANYRAAGHHELKETSENRLTLYHGLSDVYRYAVPPLNLM